MKPEILQTLSQIAILLGVLISGFGTYGSYYFGKKVEQKKEIETYQKFEDIPQAINLKIDKNTDKVLDAIKDVKQSVDEIGAIDGSNIHEIGYPESGEFGLNILDKAVKEYNIGTYSMNALIPKNQHLTIKVVGKKWGFPAFQSAPGWKHFDYEENETKISRKFKTIKFGICDLEFMLNGADEIEIFVFENKSVTPTWVKTIVVKEK